jgi:hypothetical protein
LPTSPSPIFIEVEMVGAGGGGANGNGTNSGTGGGTTTFGSSLLTCTGGGPGGGAAGTATGGDINIAGTSSRNYGNTADSQTHAAGSPGAASYFGPGGPSGPDVAGANAVSPGGGGGGGGTNAAAVGSNPGGVGGSSGGYLKKIIASPAATYPYGVGAGGNGAGVGSTGFAGGAGASGIIIVTEYYQGAIGPAGPTGPQGPAGGTAPIRNFLSGFQCAPNATTPASVLDIGVDNGGGLGGQCADSTNAVWISATASMSKNITAAWVAGNNHGGLGTGVTTPAGGTLYVFAIILSGGAVDYYFDNSLTAANKPSGVTAWRRIFSIVLGAAGAMRQFSQNGDEVLWNGNDYTVPFYSGTNTGTVQFAAMGSNGGVPYGHRIRAILNYLSNGTAGAGGELAIYDPDTPNIIGYSPMPYLVYQTYANQWVGGQIVIRTDTQGRVALYALVQNQTWQFFVMGYFDDRGKSI